MQYAAPLQYCDVMTVVLKQAPTRGFALAIDWRHGGGQTFYKNNFHDGTWGSWTLV